MKKEIDCMSDRELLMELVAGQRRSEKWRLVRICGAILVLLVLTYVVRPEKKR